jgi:hypothetical protein
MQCANGGDVTLTTCESGYRLRIVAGASISIVLSREEVGQLQAQMRAVLEEQQKQGEEEQKKEEEEISQAPLNRMAARMGLTPAQLEEYRIHMEQSF